MCEKGSEDTLNVLIIGGSLGALALNQIVPPVLTQLQSKRAMAVWHQTGAGKSAPVEQAYTTLAATHSKVTVSEFIDSVEQAYSWADVVICRAGALTVAEVSAAGRVAIFVPLPIAVDDHQTRNAQNLADQQAAIIIQQQHLAEQLPPVLSKLFTDHQYRQTMAQQAKALSPPDATQKVADFCESIIGLAESERMGGGYGSK
jgi:UDP-N-acetylglucosamine--N-acetylmuramyl-(pentapeptide) pyrophosphoryl-undecaprenol N-acetylglucosamine transferase